jgi:hypothetical protein
MADAIAGMLARRRSVFYGSVFERVPSEGKDGDRPRLEVHPDE